MIDVGSLENCPICGKPVKTQITYRDVPIGVQGPTVNGRMDTPGCLTFDVFCENCDLHCYAEESLKHLTFDNVQKKITFLVNRWNNRIHQV